MKSITQGLVPFAKDLDRLDRCSDGPGFLRRLRQSAAESYSKIGLPTSRIEDWKFTNVAPIADAKFTLADSLPHAAPGKLRSFLPSYENEYRLVFINGHFSPELSNPLDNGISVGSLRAFLAKSPDAIAPQLAQYADYENHAFTALNTALFADGAFVDFGTAKDLSKHPIHICHVTSENPRPFAAFPRNLLRVNGCSRATVIESYLSFTETPYFTNAVTEILLGENSSVDHYKMQRENRQAYHIANTQALLAKDARFRSHYIGLGGQLVRNEVRVRFSGENAEATVNGLYLASGTQHMDNLTVIDHAVPHCASHEWYKGILADKAHGVFNGKIFVRQDAQKTDAKQTNQTLLLSEDAVINTKPQLEIFADDVKCTHGATIGQLNDQALFYLRARGIGLSDARRLLTFAFANDVVSKIEVLSLREQLETMLLRTPLLSDGAPSKDAI